MPLRTSSGRPETDHAHPPLPTANNGLVQTLMDPNSPVRVPAKAKSTWVHALLPGSRRSGRRRRGNDRCIGTQTATQFYQASKPPARPGSGVLLWTKYYFDSPWSALGAQLTHPEILLIAFFDSFACLLVAGRPTPMYSKIGRKAPLERCASHRQSIAAFSIKI